MVTAAFWDTSAFVPLCVEQQPSAAVRHLLQTHTIVVWWGTAVEVRSALERLRRTHHLSQLQYDAAAERLHTLRQDWQEINPSRALRAQAENYLGLYPLSAGDALQLAAAWKWRSGDEQRQSFIVSDLQLSSAAQQAGFTPVLV